MFSGSSMIILAATNIIQKDPTITKPIAYVLGFLLNLVFNFVYLLTQNNALGLTIILLTILVRCGMLPLAFKQQKSMFIMQKIQPEIKKIQDKYKDKGSDPEIQRKMQMEMQKLYNKHGYNPFSGCLPMLIQLPIFIALYYILQNPYQFVGHLKTIYTDLGNVMFNVDNFQQILFSVPDFDSMIPKSMQPLTIDMDNLAKLMNKFTPEQWAYLKEQIPAISDQLAIKQNVEYFFGINLTERVGLGFPKIIIPAVSAITTFLSGWLMTRKNSNPNMDPAMKTQQKVMNTAMPLFMFYITSTIPGGVGIYWITSNIFQICQQLLITRYYEKKMSNGEVTSK